MLTRTPPVQRAPALVVANARRPDFDLRSQDPLHALTMTPAAWGEAFRLWSDGPGKNVENRVHARFRHLIGRWVCIHAGATVGCPGLSADEACDVVNAAARGAGRDLHLTPTTVTTRAIVAVVLLDALYPPGIGTPDAGGGPWRFLEEWGYSCCEVVPLRSPVVVLQGARGAWRVSPFVHELVAAEFARSRRVAVSP